MLSQSARVVATALFAVALAFAARVPARARPLSVAKQCGLKWTAAKAAGTTGGLTWPKFLGRCRTEMAAQPASATASVPVPAAVRVTKAPAGKAVFPTTVSSKYASEKPGRARWHTCLDQYHANKATNSNGGLKWIQKGGGYWSECTRRLKR